MASLPDRLQVQQLWVRQAGSVDLSPLGSLASLRVLHVQEGGEVTGWDALRACPIEVLTARAERADLSGLAGHRTLRSLTIRGATELPHIPNLETLKASGCQLADLPAITGIPSLRNLTLGVDQWMGLQFNDVRPVGIERAYLN